VPGWSDWDEWDGLGGDRLDVLATLAAAWEAKHHAIESPDPIEAIRFAMDQRGLSWGRAKPASRGRARV